MDKPALSLPRRASMSNIPAAPATATNTANAAGGPSGRPIRRNKSQIIISNKYKISDLILNSSGSGSGSGSQDETKDTNNNG